MVHTTEDYSSKYKATTVFPTMDLGEVAARIRPISVYDRRGNVIWYDDFEEAVLQWATTETGTGASVALTADKCWTGSHSVKLKTGTTVGNTSLIEKSMMSPKQSKIGLEATVIIPSYTSTMDIAVWIYDGTTVTVAIIRYDFDNSKLQLYNPAGGYTDIDTGVRLYTGSEMWAFIKFVVDMETNKYVRLIWGNVEYDLSSYTAYTNAGADDPKLYCSVALTTSLGSITGYIDNIIITQNEP